MIFNFRFIFFFLCSIFIQLAASAQVIKGLVQDAKTHEPLPFANVFLNNTTKGTVTDTKGEFLLRSIGEPGSYELVVSFVGYDSYKVKINISEKEIMSASIGLVPSKQELTNVDVKASRDKVWEKQLKRFEKVFLGDDKLADSCKILNPWVIDFVQEKSGKMLAYAQEPIQIENKALGYSLFFYLKYFWMDRTGYFIVGNVRFVEKQSVDEKEFMNWQINRKISYLKSRQHLFKAIIDQRIQGEGFRIYSDNNPSATTTIRSAMFKDNLGKVVFPYDTTAIVAPGKDNTYKINLKGKVEVHYQNQRALVRTYRDISYPVSWIRLNNNSVVVNKDGYELNPTDVIVSGDMSSDRVSRMLPLDYKPTNVSTLKDESGEFLSQFQEKIYVHTDKPYYYPGEPLWLKGYINYNTPSLRDSLSSTVYVELINPQKEMVLSKTLEIDHGLFNNDLILPDVLPAGTYYLRAYTTFSRNFGDANLFLKPIPVLGPNDKADPNQMLSPLVEDSLLRITLDKQKYKPREKVTLTLQLLAEDGLPISANLSMSITDNQVVPIVEPVSLVKDFPFSEKDKHKNLVASYPVEYGFSFTGRFLNDKGKPEIAILNGIQFNPQNLVFTQSDEKGIFSISGLHFYDTAIFALKADKAKDAPYGKIELVERNAAAMDFKIVDLKVDLLPIKSPKRMVTEYEVPRGTRLLNEVEIKASRINVDATDYRIKRPYGKPDYVLKGKDINTGYGNLLFSLQGKFPGLNVRQANNEGQLSRWVVYLQRGLSILNPAEVLITVNNAIMTGTPESILSAINPNTVESIELKSGVNVLYGGLGGNGILAIYTKTDVSDEQVIKAPNFQQIKVPGYSPARRFRYPDYDDPETDKAQPDFRSTIYWNPNVINDPKTGLATVSFYTADLAGSYRVVVQGITQQGEPVMSEYFFEVDR